MIRLALALFTCRDCGRRFFVDKQGVPEHVKACPFCQSIKLTHVIDPEREPLAAGQTRRRKP